MVPVDSVGRMVRARRWSLPGLSRLPDSVCPAQDLTALAKELRAVEDVRPPHKVTDYSSSSEESGTTDEEDDDVEQEGAEEPTSGPEDTRAASVPLSVRGDECPRGLPRWLSGKRPSCQRRRCGFDPWVGKIPGEGNGNPFQCSCLGDPTDRGAWRAAVHGVAESQTPRSVHSRLCRAGPSFQLGHDL